VAEDTRSRVRSAIDELGFVRNESARRLRQGPETHARATPARTLGLVVEDLANQFYIDVARGAEAALNDAGVTAIWSTSDGSPEKEERCLDLLAGHRAAGLLITPVTLDSDRIARLREHGMSVVLVDRALPGVCSATVDHVAGGHAAVTHLLRQRPGRIAFVTGALAGPSPSIRPVRDRLVGAARALEGIDMDKPAILSEPAMTTTAGQAAARRLLDLKRAPSAVFCANDMMAIGLLNELLRVGVKVPGELAVVGYDDIELAATAAVPLTTVRQPLLELGQTAAELLLAETEGAEGHTHQQIVLTPELVIRESA
jgi:DNA-binding LacI/PurR family transcriptional regulator